LKATTDPVSLASVSVIAGVNQATDRFSGYGQGAQGYAKRYGASYANFATGLFIGGAVLPVAVQAGPSLLVEVGVLAGIDQAGDRWGAYGQGARGYGKRYGASYAKVFSHRAVMPSVLKQDPRYFYKGTGSKKSRILYALASSVICKGDNGHWQPNYSSVTGSFAGGSSVPSGE
jgi:hypothetical protein